MHSASPPIPRRAWLLAALGVLAFALSIPMTRLASGSSAEPALPPMFVAIGRAVVAGLLASVYLLYVRAQRPSPAQWRSLAAMAAGVVFGWPLFLGWAVREVDAIHAAVISGLLPLGTAVAASWALGQRAGLRFWTCALLGLVWVLLFAAWRGAGALAVADLLLLAAVACSSFGYVHGARLSGQMPPEQVISWALVLCLPLTLPLAAWVWLVQGVGLNVPAPAWGGFAYVAVVSMWMGFFPWYRALALGGALRVGQVQTLQPFLSVLLAVPLLGEQLDLAVLGFLVLVLATVVMGQRSRSLA
ncbi:drug/metabolite transporter (DMT)-like permease [Inhella inkyongensis]|uniref:Drug/metabolite transporter (DMT)-like permease n=1 Tax=Inhella inkyongensis TaxID=392593 RepID=A0A840S9R1_9BURK|nr:DMT family transporter [Inhella inkyongensis]MBB5205736.1 drug/metabolite transporter (DMT)-like permease [Inhella inkyongensis]